MVIGNATWTAALSQAKKRPLYILEFPSLGIRIVSFVAAEVQVSDSGGWGVMLWGITPWGQ